ncbi:hypothetical protein [Blastococcus goldschmidtiae]|uniref:Uncharacterized protein n=1 Tax=Blastococcus goldschmidtiae TaxID=3075546 RepID=A0ABU2KB31_9ACTN|nr:hypothetical protein [Blastococcus sp. DSM 46792]MDT0277368.1 hypothetical protein [Blastococcus sp. DSM 46792]
MISVMAIGLTWVLLSLIAALAVARFIRAGEHRHAGSLFDFLEADLWADPPLDAPASTDRPRAAARR